MKTIIKQLIATSIIVTLGILAIRASIHLAMLTIDNTQTLAITTLGLSIWIGAITLWILARTLIHLRDQPEDNTFHPASPIYTESELSARDRQQELTSFLTSHQERLKRRYAIPPTSPQPAHPATDNS